MKINAHAKLNLCLDILHKREDGFHEISFVNTELELCDEITLEKVEDEDISITCNVPHVPTDSRNVCYKACEALGVGARISIEKRIPFGGLGGGSTDCAAVLRGLNDLYELGHSVDELVTVAASISTDACFSLVGRTCLVGGKGELVEQIRDVPKLWVVIFDPHVRIAEKTKKIYSRFDINKLNNLRRKRESGGSASGGAPFGSVAALKEAIVMGDVKGALSNCGNAFESIDFSEYTPVFTLIDEIRSMGYTSMLAGAGPLVVGLCENESDAQDMVEKINKLHSAYSAIITSTIISTTLRR